MGDPLPPTREAATGEESLQEKPNFQIGATSSGFQEPAGEMPKRTHIRPVSWLIDQYRSLNLLMLMIATK